MADRTREFALSAPASEAAAAVELHPRALVDAPPQAAAEAAAAHALERVGARTRTVYLAAWRRYADHAGEGAMVALAAPDGQGQTARRVQRWVQAMRDAGCAPASIRVRVAAVQALIAAARELGAHGWSVRPRLPARGAVGGRPLAPWHRVAAMLAHLAEHASDGERQARDAAVVHLAAHSALRRGEIASVRAEHLDLSDDAPAVRVTRKGGASVWQPISRATRDILATYTIPSWRGRDPGPMFRTVRGSGGRPSAGVGAPTIGAIIRSTCAAHGMDLRAHDLRRCALIRAARVTHDPDLVRRLAGHRSMATTATYLDRHDGAVALAVAAVAGERGQEELPAVD